MDFTKGAVRKMWKPGSLSGADAIAEAAAAKGKSNLYRTSCYFKDLERYESFCALYAVLRLVSDRVKNFLVGGEDCSGELCEEFIVVQAWRRVISAVVTGHDPVEQDVQEIGIPQLDQLLVAFARATERFPVPECLWGAFVTSMERDLQHHRFETFDQVVEYAAGTAVCPATIYLYLVLADEPDETGVYQLPPDFDLLQCSRDFGLLGYIAHSLRDFRQDLATGKRGHLYIAAEDMARHGVTERKLFDDLVSGMAGSELQALVREMVERARASARRGREGVSALEPYLSPDRAFMLKLIVRSYEATLDKIVFHSYNVMTDDHRLTEAELENVALEVATLMGMAPNPSP
jgi:phytoene/squalene synthetase